MRGAMEVLESRFKETEIGLIPEDWEVVKLGEVFEVKQGKQLSAKENRDGKVLKPFLRTSNVLWNKIDLSEISYMPFSESEFENLKLKKGDILVCEGGDVGRTAVWDGQIDEISYQNHLHRLRSVKDNINNYFFAYWMEYAITIKNLYHQNANKTTIPNLSSSRLKAFPIPLPPLEEQKAIADILSTVQNNIEKTEKVINATKQLKKSMMKHLFTYGAVEVDEIDKVKLKESEIGLIPEHWEVVMLGEVVEIYDNKRVPLSESVRKNMKGVYPYCGANGIIDYVNDYIFDGEYVLVAEDGGRYGKFENTAYIMNGKFWVNNHAHILQAKVGISINRFILHWFTYADISQYVSGTTRQKLTLSTLKSFPISLPPLDEQQKIANILTTIDQKIQAEEKKKQTLQNLFKTLLQQLMTGKIRVRHPS